MTALSEIRALIPALSNDAKNRIRELLDNAISALSNEFDETDVHSGEDVVAENRKTVRSACKNLRADLR
jgi:hypothetical protein